MAIIMMNNGTIILILFSIVLLNLFFPFTNLFYTELNVNIQPPSASLYSHHHNRHNRSSQLFYEKLRYENLLNIQPIINDQIQSDNIYLLVKRLLPHHYYYFNIIVDHNFISNGHLDRFKIESIYDDKPKIQIKATTGVAAANGFYYYLKYITNSSISWSGDHINIKQNDLPPMIDHPIEMIIKEKFRYYQNACTTSYSMVWWQWPRWQRELDWMALNGINLALAFNGQEIIFRRTFEKFNLTIEEIDEYFTGPAYLAWNRMGNIQTWSGPLSEHWHEHQTKLQRKILKRMRQLGMFPVVPGFSGHVPRAFRQKFPLAKMNRLANWNHFGANFSQTYFLEPEDPYFIQIGKTFIEEYTKMYGTDHFYNIDMFVEETPSSRNLLYLHRCGKGVYESIRQADPKGIWLLQGYPFNSLYDKFWGPKQVKALVTAVPINKMLILDNIAEVIPIYSQTDGYFGQPFIWCILHNYGGVNGMFGSLNRINQNGVFDARDQNPNMLGIGITPEGIEQNDIVYDYMLEIPWYNQAPNQTEWFSRYYRRRYGINDQHLDYAWQLLRKSVYNDPIGIKNHGRYIFISRPRPHSHSMLWYDPKDISKALCLFYEYLEKNPKIIHLSDTFVHDLVDISRQTLQLIFDYYYKIMDNAFENRKQQIQILHKSIQQLRNVLDLTESILQSCKHCLLYNWINDARLLGNDTNEKNFNEWQARTQISIWGPKSNIANYAAKQWSGMFRYLYKPRWELYFNEMVDCINHNRTYNGKEFRQKLFESIDLPFTQQKIEQNELIKEANVSNLILNVDSIINMAAKSIDLQTTYKYYYNDTERWLE
ncbi:alpha-N-acetylglucosaminidase-like [Dermatophagoides pteronyssinus]|uniref:alpha-N-acetylglucosaminidase-like n=1 Tax=Dermatophagoides pteronyssinus TaxID=6956 RepID=UPI003F662305